MTTEKRQENGTQTKKRKHDVDNTDLLCGLGFCHPSCLQKCGNIMTYSIFYGMIVLLTNALNIYISSQITTLEKQFDFSSSQAGFILSCNDIGFILTVLVVSHFGVKYHIPRILSLFTIIYGLSGIATSGLQLLSNHGMSLNTENILQEKNNSYDILCLTNRTVSTKCNDSNNDGGNSTSASGSSLVLMLLCIFMGFQGVGKAPRSSLGTFYIDRNVQEKTKTGFYLGISTTMGLFGPFLAITLGGLFGKIPVDLEDTTIQPNDQRWIGAWWIGFLLFGVLAVIFAVPLLFFPKTMLIKKEEQNTDDEDSVNTCCMVVKDIPKAICRIIKTPVYPLVVSALAIFLFGVLGGASFGPKYIENQFNIPTWKANVILGGEKLVTATLGTFIGGYLTSRWKLSRQGCIKMVIIIMFVTTAINSLNYIFGCENAVIRGNDESFHNCDCSSVPFMAVCDGNGKTFHSPCQAGCSNVTANIFGGCTETNEGTVKAGICHNGCQFLVPYIAVQVVNTFFGTMSILPVYLVILRSLNEKDRSIALGMQSFIYSLIVFIPAPIVYGHLFDSFCLEWNHSCGTKGSCALYDIELMRYSLTSIEVGTRALVFVLYIIIFHVARWDDAKYGNSSKKLDMELEIKSQM